MNSECEFSLSEFCRQAAAEMSVSAAQVEGAVRLLDDDNTIPFIARYRKEATRGLDERQLRKLEDLLTRARELVARKKTVLRTLANQGQLTAALQEQVRLCREMSALEEIYLPYKPRKRTRAAAARESGLQPLADLMRRSQPTHRSRTEILRRFVNPDKGISDEAAAIQGACDILAEEWANEAGNRRWMLTRIKSGEISSVVRRGKKDEGARFSNYFEFRERVAKVPAHRFLAMLRGESENVLRLSISIDDESSEREFRDRVLSGVSPDFRKELSDAAKDCYERLLRPAAESDVLQETKHRSDIEAVEVFARNLRDLLLSPPAGSRVTIGIDPGYRTGCKIAVVDATGRFLCHETIFPTPPREDKKQAAETLLRLIETYRVALIAIGNGTASRETDSFVADLIRQHNLPVTRVLVNEAGASVYSASETAISEYPELDVTVRGAISIAHRLQDPLAELVKIDPQSIGVGQYQHDVDQKLLRHALDREVESCVNSVGVDANTASPSLLARVVGIGSALARGIVAFRDENGPFHSRHDLLKVPRFGRKAFQQAAGFLRIRDGKHPLDNSAVHPEQYALVERMAATLSAEMRQIVGNAELTAKLQPADFICEEFGPFTVADVLDELKRPGRDPRSEFRAAQFSETVLEIDDLTEGMVLEGVATNVTRFGVFVDIGVHQDGLVHVSQLARRFVKDPAEEVSVGDIFKVRVLEVDRERRRISLTRLLDGPGDGSRSG